MAEIVRINSLTVSFAESLAEMLQDEVRCERLGGGGPKNAGARLDQFQWTRPVGPSHFSNAPEAAPVAEDIEQSGDDDLQNTPTPWCQEKRAGQFHRAAFLAEAVVVLVEKNLPLAPAGGKANQPDGVIGAAQRAVARHRRVRNRDDAALTHRYFHGEGTTAGPGDDFGDPGSCKPAPPS